MEELDKLVADSLDRYFTVLGSIGYVSETNTNKLILLQFLQEFLQEYQGYITEADYTKIESILQCLAGSSCLIPFKEYMLISQPIQGYIYTVPVRITQESVLRQVESDGDLRLVNQ